MDFIEFQSELNEHLKVGDISTAISIAENKLNSYDKTDFHKVIGRDLLKLSSKLIEFIDTFYISAKKEMGENLKAISCEMNGITINYDLWFINLFGFETVNENEEDFEEWLSDYDFYYDKEFIISGFEDLQDVYKDYVKNERWDEENLETQLDLSEIIMILRLQELFKETYEKAKNEKYEWSEIPIFINGHDVELYFKTK